MSVPVDSSQHPGFLYRFWLFLVRLTYSFVALFKSNATSTTLPTPVTAGSLATRHKPTLFRRLGLVNVKFSSRLGLQKRRFAGQALTATETHEDFIQPCSSNNCDISDDQESKTYSISGSPGFIDGTVFAGCVSEDGIVRVSTPFSTPTQSSKVERCNSITSIASMTTNSDLVSRSVSFGIVSVCRSPTCSFLSVSPVRHRFLGIPHSIDFPLTLSQSVRSISTPPLAIRRGFLGGSVRMPRLTIRLESPWSPSDKTLPLDVWMSPKGILVNAHGSLGTTPSSQAEAVTLRYTPRTNSWRAPSLRSTCESEDAASAYSYMVTEKGYTGKETYRRASQVFTTVGPYECSPLSGVVTIATPTLIEASTSDIAQISILDAIQTSEDVEPKKAAQDHTLSTLHDCFSYVAPESGIDIVSDDETPGHHRTPSLNRKVCSPAAIGPLRRTGRAAKYFSVPYLSPVLKPDQRPVRASASSSSISLPDAVEDRHSRALADLIALLDLAALQTAETTGISEICMGDYVVRAT